MINNQINTFSDTDNIIKDQNKLTIEL